VTFQRPCLDCGVLTMVGNRCQQHRAAAQAKWKEGRPNPYLDPAWRKLSSQMRRKHPWCEVCGKTTDLTVDHLDPLSKGGPLLAEEHRLRVVCRTCHGRQTAHK
jgi:5-methylcytosine-specific restriction endonuclease McrA